MATAGHISGLVIQALRYIGKEHANDKIVNTLKSKLTSDNKRQLMRHIRYAPAWIGMIFRRLQE
jgi:hypothetical protein